MSLRFFSDQCVPAEITDTLRRHGHQVTVLREVLPIRSLDRAVMTTTVFVLLAIRTRKEEENLIARFGDDYRNYMQRTGRFVPRL